MQTSLALLGFLLAAALAGAQEAPAPVGSLSVIRRVTVYPDRALVTREAKLQVSAGTSTFTFLDLPAGILGDSVRAKIQDGDRVQLRGIEVKTYTVLKVVGDGAKALELEREKIQEELRSVQDRISAIAMRREFVLSVKAAAGREASAAVLTEKLRIEDLKGAAAFIEEALLEIAAKMRLAEKERRDLQAREHLIASELARLVGGEPLLKRSVAVTIEAPQAAAATVEISYIIVGAGWVPFYDIHASVDRGEAAILYFGQILQATGEDWRQVELSLSTAHPARSARMPNLQPLVVGVMPGKDGVAGLRGTGNPLQRSWLALNGIIQQQNDAVYNKHDYQSFELPPDLPEAQMSSYVFRIKTAETILSNGSPHKVTIAQSTFKSGVERVATPKLSAHVYLKTQVHNTSDFPYMPGDMNIFLENDFIGSGAIEMVSPGERFEVFLGADQGIKVTRKLESKKLEAGTLQKAHYLYLIKVENFKGKAAKVIVLDQLPVSRDSDIEVIADPDLTPPTSRTADGLLTWELEIGPGQSKEIRLGYRIYYPANKPVHGLE
jgi:uncharacterized protein (TIGR02231 family)